MSCGAAGGGGMSSDLNGQLDVFVGRWKPYPNCRDSGVVWFGDVPDHWKLTPLGYSVRIVSGSTPSKENPAFWNGDIPWVSPKDMKQWEIVDSEDHITQEAVRLTTISLIKEGSVLIVIRGMILARDVPVAVTKIPVTINQDMKALQPRRGIVPEFLAHQIRGLRDAFHSILEESAHGMKCLRTDLWTKLNILVPPEDEQRAICGFINQRVAKIDALIAKKERLIELLQEKRTALISHAVTKGLDPTVTMMDSGVAWLGKVPGHWGVIQSRRVFKVRNEPAAESDEQLTASQKYGMIPQTEFMELEGRRVVVTIKGVDSLRHVEPNDFVISLRSFQGGIEWCKLRGSATFHYVVLKPVKMLHPAYFGGAPHEKWTQG
jgi:type I restriction enzyme S subunit